MGSADLAKVRMTPTGRLRVQADASADAVAAGLKPDPERSSVKAAITSLLTSVLLSLAVGPAIAGNDVLVAQATAPQTPVESIDHAAWNGLLQKYVDRVGMVDYAAWKGSAADVALLDSYLQQLAGAQFAPGAPRSAVLAFWINAYNAVTVRGILREYPTTSIRNHTATLWGYNIWKNLLLPVDGKNYSLDEIEHKVLRPMSEFRVHFALVCASIGCPPLRDEAYIAGRLDEQLDDNSRAFFADPKRFGADPANETLLLSPILQWYSGDFGADRSAQLRTIAHLLPTDEARGLATSGRATVRYLDYDWGLNEQRR